MRLYRNWYPDQDRRPQLDSSGIYFLFGDMQIYPSEKFADLFGNRGPADVNDPSARDVQWISRGPLEAAPEFIARLEDLSLN